ncbi:MAG: TPM domain-containing protein [Candidatus Hydrogenedentes bacterium]|nr:TPM domain-containing protein [Candidatus Hydrogenedentota bacterium]
MRIKVSSLYRAGLALSVLCSGIAVAQQINIAPPDGRAVVVDLAHLVAPDDALAIQEIGDALLAETPIPIFVVTIESMAGVGWRRDSIEGFARNLFEQWGKHPAFDARALWRQGILIVVSRNDRKARIELGADWGGAYDGHSELIMSEIMVPAFRDGEYSSGIVAGVEALHDMARGGAAPESGDMEDWKFILLFCAGLAGAFLIIWCIARLLERFNPPRKRRHIGDGFDHIDWGPNEYGGGTSWTGHYDVGGGFGGGGGGGGGFGGGGGATGSW